MSAPPRRSVALAGLALGLGCGPGQLDLWGPFPPGTERVAAMWLDERGEVLAATGLLRFEEEAAVLRPVPAADSVVALAWGAGSLPDGPDDRMETDPIALAGPRSPRLPDPDWAGRAGPGGGPLVEGLDPRPLTAPWLPACPTIVGEEQAVAVDQRCARSPCLLRFPQVGCRVVMLLDICGLPNLELEVDGTGGLQVVEPKQGCSVVGRPPRGAFGSLSCEACPFDLYAAPRELVSDLEPVEKLVLGRGEPDRASAPAYRGDLRSLALGTDRAFASTAFGCDRREPGMVHVIDIESFAPVGALVHGGCEEALLTPDGEGALLVTRTATVAIVQRLDRDGRPTATAPLPGPVWRPIGLVASSVAERVAVLLQDTDGEDRFRESVLHILRLDDLRPVARFEAEVAGATGGLVFTADGGLLLSRRGQVLVVDPQDGASQGSFLAGTGEGIDNRFVGMSRFDQGRVVAFSAGSRSGVHVLEENRVSGFGVYFGRRLVLTGLISHPGRDPRFEGLGAGFIYDDPRPEGFLLRFSPGDGRFAPEAVRVGVGPVLGLSVDGRGRAWAVLPQEGAVMRAPLGRF